MSNKRDCPNCSPIAPGCKQPTMSTWRRRKRDRVLKCRRCAGEDAKARKEGTRK